MFVYGIYDKLKDEEIVIFGSENDGLAKREFLKHIVEWKNRTPSLDLKEFALIRIKELRDGKRFDLEHLLFANEIFNKFLKRVEEENEERNNL